MVGAVYESPVRKAQKEATRQALKSAAKALFATEGYATTGVGQITAAAGVAKGTFYVHFHDKDELLDELLQEFNDGFLAEVTPLLAEASIADARGLVTQLAGAFLDYWLANRDFIRVYAERAAAGLAVDALQFGLNPQMRQALRDLLKSVAALDDETLELVIQGVLSMWLRLGLQYIFKERADREKFIRTLVGMTTGALGGVLA